MGYKNHNGIDVLTNIRKTRISVDNPCHQEIINANPYEFWRFENITNDTLPGMNSRADFEIYDESLNYSFNSNVLGLSSSNGISGLTTNNVNDTNNAFIARMTEFITQFPTEFSLQFWYKPTEHENKILSVGNDITDFGLKDVTGAPNTINQFNIDCEQVYNNQTNNYDVQITFREWVEEQMVEDNGYYILPEPSYENVYTIEDIELSIFQQFIIIYDDENEDGLFSIYHNGVNVHNEQTSRTLVKNTSPLAVVFGYAVEDGNLPYEYDELAFYDYALTEQQIQQQHEVCETLPSLGGWSSQLSSKYLNFETDLYYKDVVYYGESPENVWNNALGFRNNNSGNYQFEFHYNGAENNNSIGFGLADNSISKYTKLGSNLPCSENSMGLYRENGEWILYTAFNREYDTVQTSKTFDLNDGSIITVFADLTNNEIEFYIDDNFIVQYSFIEQIENINLYPCVSMSNNLGNVQLNTVGNYEISNNDYVAWGTVKNLPESRDEFIEFDWEGTYQELILRDNPEYYWRFQENTGLNAVDEINNVRLNHQSSVKIARSGVEGFGIYYDTTDRTYLNTFPPVYEWINGAIEFWIYYNGALDTTGRLMELRSDGNDWHIRLSKNYVNNNPIMEVLLFENDLSGNNVTDLQLPMDGYDFENWNHIVLQVSENRLFQCYVNGLLSLEICGVNWANKFVNHLFSINSSVSDNVSFYFDELAFYDQVLDQDTVQEHYLVGNRIVEDVEDLDLIFNGIPDIFTSTNDYVVSSYCDNTVRYWGWQSEDAQWKEFSSVSTTDTLQIASSTYHAVINDDETITGFGRNELGQCNQPSVINRPVIMLGAGDFHSLALLSDNTVYAWGDNSWGQTMVPENMGTIVQIDCGTGHNTALRSNGSVVCWGKNDKSECDVPEQFTDIIQVCAGESFSAALGTNGTVEIWGDDTWGVSAVQNLTNVIQISSMACSQHITALTSDGVVHCFGYNGYGQCDVPTSLPSIERISNGKYSTFAQDSDENVYAWGVIFNSANEQYDVDSLIDTNCSSN